MIRKELLIVSVLTFITVCAWVVFDILHTRAKVEIPQKVQEVIEPINPEFNTQVFESAPVSTESGSTP